MLNAEDGNEIWYQIMLELRKAAELWNRVGWRDAVVFNEEIACGGVLHISLVRMDWLLVRKSMVLKNVINVKSFRAIRL